MRKSIMAVVGVAAIMGVSFLAAAVIGGESPSFESMSNIAIAAFLAGIYVEMGTHAAK